MAKPTNPSQNPIVAWRQVVLENALDAVIGVDEFDTVIDWNRQAEEVFGWSKDEALGQKMADLIIPAEMRAMHARGMQRYVATRDARILDRRIELEAINKQGRTFPVELTVIRVQSDRGLLFYSFLRDLTEQRRQKELLEKAEAALRKSENQLRLITNAVPAFIAYIDRDRRYQFVNEAYPKWFGRKIEDILGKRLIDFAGPETAEKAAPIVQRALAGERVKYEAQISRGDGQRGWVEADYIPDVDQRGEVQGAVILGYDVTEQRKAESTLRASEIRFRTLFEQAPFSIQLLSPDGRTIQVNQAWRKLWNIPDEVINGYILKDYNLLHDPQLAAKGLAPYIRRGFQGEVVEIPAVLYDPAEAGVEGRARWVEGFMYPVKDVTGEIMELVLVHEDVTDEYLAGEERQRLNAVIENSSDFIGVADLDQNVIYVNRAGQRMVGMESAEEVRGTKVWDYFSPEEYERISRVVIPPTLGEGRWEGEVQFFNRRTGTATTVLMNSFSIKDRSGKLVAFANVSRDITDLKRTQHQLEEAIRARDEFLSICSHELKTPVTSMKLQFQMAQRQIESGRAEVYLKERVEKRVTTVNRQLNRLANLIEDMLDVSRIATGNLSMSFEELDLVALVKDVLERFGEQFQVADYRVTADFPGEELMISADRYRIEQVVDNLLTNALKYGRGNPVELSVAASESGDTVCLKVKDRGIGIPEEKLAFIFNRFERAVGSQGISGLGLGLYVSRQIVEAHHGSIKVQSKAGQGSIFMVELPLIRKPSSG